MAKSFKVIESKLKRHKAYGLAHLDDNTIEIDERLEGRKKLEIIIHECLHLLNTEWEEDKVVEQSKRICVTLWKLNYRQVDNKKGDPLQ